MIKIKLTAEDYQKLCKVLESSHTTNFYDARTAELNHDVLMTKIYDNLSATAKMLFEKIKKVGN